MARPSKRPDGFPTRSDMQFWTPAEHAIARAVEEVEDMGADPALTEAVILLGKARGLVADFAENTNEAEFRFEKYGAQQGKSTT